MTQTENPVTDVLIIGGSHAGLSAALTLYRALHTAVVFDCNKPRNDYSTPVRLTPTWENQSTDKLRDTARQELLSAGLTTFVDAAVQTVEQRPDGLFKLVDERDHTWVGRKVLLAIGARDVFPDLPGYPELFTQGMYVNKPSQSPGSPSALISVRAADIHVCGNLGTSFGALLQLACSPSTASRAPCTP